MNKLCDLINTAIKTQDIIANMKENEYMIYSKKCNMFIWCDCYGNAIEDEDREYGYEIVLFDGAMFENEDYYLTPTKKDDINLKDIIIKGLVEQNGKLTIGYTENILCKKISISGMNFGKDFQNKLFEKTPSTYSDIYFAKEIENHAKYNKDKNEIIIKLRDDIE